VTNEFKQDAFATLWIMSRRRVRESIAT
jgi:hypothetical protein